ncbi:sulfotransferase domain-containing protein [Roseivirga sp.]|uniref:sulfotransferase domain-containing protein n=1 Tax=Roseivirga sp. TaxID=1964215 RepID=UPI003B8BDAC2
MSYPDFLCIGAQKSGTTWLHHQLSLHPQIWLPLVKELHYFDRPRGNRLIYKILSPELQGKFVRGNFRHFLRKNSILWTTRFIFGKRTDEYYKALFKPDAEQVSGEVTPAYAWLDANTIAHIHQLMPATKLIYLIRYPVDRVWSQINMYKRRTDVNSEISNEEVLKIKHKRLFEHTSYTYHIKRWTSYFDNSQLFIGFFDQIEKAPNRLIKDVFCFLGVDANYSSIQLEKDLITPQNQGCHGAIPAKLEYELTQKLLPEIEAIHQRFDNEYTRQWMQRANEVLNKSTR